MPLQENSAVDVSHRDKERFDLQYFHNPFTDIISAIDEPFQPPSDWQRARIDAAVARSVSKDEATANKDAQAALRNEWDRLRDIGTWIEDGVREYSDVVAELKGKTAH
eukprot:6386082-Pyramimonas_sp.AAC.1